MQLFRILVVDDHSEFRRFICSMLQPRAGFKLAEASDGLEAVQKALELKPDLILLDVSLPKLNGIEVAKRVCELAPDTRILFCSVECDTDLVREALSLSAGYIYKPRVYNDLLPAIDAVLRGEHFVSRDLKINGRMDAPQSHEAQFYSADSIFLESFTRFLATALWADNPAIVLATKFHREGLIQRLKGQGFDIDSAIQQGTYISLDAPDMLSSIMVAGVPDCIQFFEGLHGLIESATKSARQEHPRVAVCGECAPLLCAAGHLNAAIQLEKTGNELMHTHNIDILCGYPLSGAGFSGKEGDPLFKSICAEHTSVRSR